MKHNPKIHSQIHSENEKPVHVGVYRVILDDEYWCKWRGDRWGWASESKIEAEDERLSEFVRAPQDKRWYGLRNKP